MSLDFPCVEIDRSIQFFPPTPNLIDRLTNPAYVF
ncbi:uncharacterized protein METZ01_LOCUS254348 [marine metagenome]|uniref:Uncharacterized protein n=1 Tax=marine metagenome TaxID=408172 RepID=A0A382INY4_9ZZZZ